MYLKAYTFVYNMAQEAVHARLSKKDLEQIKTLIEQGYYSSISDALRHATRLLLKEHKPTSQIEHSDLWESALKEAEGHLEIALNIFHKKLGEPK